MMRLYDAALITAPTAQSRPSAQLPTGMRRPSRRPRPSHGPARSGFPQACSHGFPTGPRAASFPTGPQAASFPTGPQATSRERQAYLWACLWAWGPIADARVIGDARACLFGLRLPVRGGCELKLKVSKSPRRARGESSGESTVYAKRRPRRPRRADRTEAGRRARRARTEAPGCDARHAAARRCATPACHHAAARPTRPAACGVSRHRQPTARRRASDAPASAR